MQIQNAIITGSFSYNGADLSNVTSSNAYSASLSSRTTNLESTSSVLVGASASFSSILTSVSSSQQQISASILTLTASFNAVSASQQQISASYIALSGSYNTFSGSASTRITANSSSIQQVSSSQQQISSSLLNVISIFATTGSNSFRANQSITGSLVVSSTITAQTLVVQTVTSSIVYSSGSNIFGCDLNSRQTFTGSVLITGSLTIAGASSATSYSGATIYGSTAVCSPVGKFTSCIDVGGAGTFSGNVGITVANTPEVLLTHSNTSKTFLMAVDGSNAFFRANSTNNILFQYAGGTTALTINGSNGAACFACCITAPGLQINSPTYVPLVINSSYGQVGANFSLNGTTFGGIGSANNFSSDAGIAATDMGMGTNGTSTGKIVFATGTGYATRMIITSAGIACFASTVCAPSFIGGTMSGTTIYGSTAVCSPVGYFSGCVGINCSAPSGKLQVANSSTQYALYTLGGNLELYTPEGNYGYVRLGSAYNLNGIYGSCGLNYIISGTSNHVFYTTDGPTERMRISCNGKISISAPTTADAFTVQGANNYWTSILTSGTTTSQAYGLYVKAGTNATDIPFLIQNTSGTDILRILGTGAAIFNCNGTYCSNYGYNFLCANNGSILSGTHTMGNVGAGTTCATPYWCSGGALRMEFNWSSGTHIQWINHNNCTPFLLQWSADSNATKHCFDYSGNASHNGSLTNSGKLITKTSSGGGTFKQVVVGQTTAAASGVAKKIVYVSHTHSVRVYVWATQSTGNGSSAIADITSLYGSTTGGITSESNYGTTSDISISYNNGGSPAYTIDVTLTYTGAAPTINFVVEGINDDNNIYTT